MRGFCLTAALSIAVPVAAASAQSTESLFERYRDAVRAYQRGDREGAAGRLTPWSRPDLERVIRLMLASRVRDRRLEEAAAMLHTEIALDGMNQGSKAASVHLPFAEQVVRALPTPHASPFEPRWYAFAASLFLARSSPEGARPFVQRGLDLFAKDPRLHVMAGAIEEMVVHNEDPECSEPGCDSRGFRSQTPLRLATAEVEYRRALDLDRQFFEARLRLGRVLFLQNQRKRAREELDTVRQRSTDRRLQYLAHLFLGALDDYEKSTRRSAR